MVVAMASDENSMKALMAYFSIPDRPVKASEFKLFWMSCNEKDKEYFSSAPLS